MLSLVFGLKKGDVFESWWVVGWDGGWWVGEWVGGWDGEGMEHSTPPLLKFYSLRLVAADA